jgi:predicted DNA-binding transcriptional regulator YafY
MFKDGDAYTNPKYRDNFQKVLSAIHNREVLTIGYSTTKDITFSGTYQPLSLEYSLKNDKFRLLTAKLSKHGKYRYYVLNLSKVEYIKPNHTPWNGDITVQGYFKQRRCPEGEPITVEVLDERNSIERFMMEFACYEKHTEYTSQSGRVVSKIWYDISDEAELLIRLLSFGATLEILSPQRIRDEAKRRIFEQYRLLNGD